MTKTCVECRYYSPSGSAQAHGNCRRYPPLAASGGMRQDTTTPAQYPIIFSWWPSVTARDWCGEYLEIANPPDPSDE